MNTSCQQMVMLFLCVFAHHASCGTPCFSAEPQSPTQAEFEKKASQLDTLAKAKRPWKPGADCGYYFSAAQLAKQLKESPPDRKRVQLAAKVLEGLLAKEFKLSEITFEDIEEDERCGVGVIDLQAAQDLAYYVIDNDAASDQDRQNNARLLARYLGRIRKEKTPNYKPKDVGLNVAPPVSAPGEPMAAGMDPEDIKDPVAKAAYKAAIRKRCENNIWNVRQSELNGMDQPPTYEAIKRYIADTFRGRRDCDTAVAECMKNAMLTDKEQKEVRDCMAEEASEP